VSNKPIYINPEHLNIIDIEDDKKQLEINQTLAQILNEPKSNKPIPNGMAPKILSPIKRKKNKE